MGLPRAELGVASSVWGPNYSHQCHWQSNTAISADARRTMFFAHPRKDVLRASRSHPAALSRSVASAAAYVPRGVHLPWLAGHAALTHLASTQYQSVRHRISGASPRPHTTNAAIIATSAHSSQEDLRRVFPSSRTYSLPHRTSA